MVSLKCPFIHDKSIECMTCGESMTKEQQDKLVKDLALLAQSSKTKKDTQILLYMASSELDKAYKFIEELKNSLRG